MKMSTGRSNSKKPASFPDAGSPWAKRAWVFGLSDSCVARHPADRTELPWGDREMAGAHRANRLPPAGRLALVGAGASRCNGLALQGIHTPLERRPLHGPRALHVRDPAP